VTRFVALLLVLVLLLSSSGAATLCVEADGTTRVELLGAVCCDAASAPEGDAEPDLASTTDCAGCDDTPLADGSWSRPGADSLEGALLTLALPPAESPPAPAPSGRVSAASDRRAPAPSPRDARPASSLRC